MLKAIDLFAGIGGFSEGARQAGVDVVWAANHWQLAVQYHSANHPGTLHVCQDLHQANWASVPKHDIILASPACQGHTHARGKEKPHHDALRSTAWAVVSCAEYHRSEFCIVENVPEFLDWNLYPSWEDAMRRLGYCVSPHIIDSADHGVPQHRVRLFLIITRSTNPLKLNLPNRPHRPVAEVIEWEQHRWNPIERRGRSAKTLSRIANGRRDFGECFVAPFYSSGSGLTGRSIHRPIGTFSTVDRWALIRGKEMRMFQPSEIRSAMGLRSSYVLPKNRRAAIHLLGNGVTPIVATDILNELKKAA
jgi:DNA (cytosine-5)-methyltransferase 1